MSTKKYLIAFVLCILLATGAVILANRIETDFGKVAVEKRCIVSDYEGVICGKLYIPVNATAAHPAPAVLAMHGYQNDKDTNAAYAIELARAGFVVYSMDSYGHGDTTVPLRERGWDNSRDGWQKRYALMTSFNLLQGEVDGLKETTLGGDTAFNYLQSLDVVDETRVGITGHSLGTWSGWETAKLNPDHAAIVIQCGEPEGPVFDENGEVTFKNVLMLQAEFDEFEFFRDMQLLVPQLNETELRYSTFAGQDVPIEWDQQYGDFENGTAREMNLYHTNHRLVTHTRKAVFDAVSWFKLALGNDISRPDSQIFIWKEILMLFAMLTMLVSTMPMFNLLTSLKVFASIKGEMPSRYIPDKKSWWKTTLIAIGISAISYPFLTQLGHGLFPLPEMTITRTLIANGVSVWFGFLIVVSVLIFVRWYRKGAGKQAGVTMYDMGVSYDKDKTVIDWVEIAKVAAVGVIMFGVIYLFTFLSAKLGGIELRFIWPMFRPFSGIRFGQFLVYIPIYLAFFLFNGGIKLFGQLRQEEFLSPIKTQFIWWLKNIIVMLGGLFVVILFEYIPFFAGIGPGFEAVGLSLFGGPFMSALLLIVPQFMVLFFFTTWFYRKTGKVYLGALMTTLYAVWIVTAGSAYF